MTEVPKVQEKKRFSKLSGKRTENVCQVLYDRMNT